MNEENLILDVDSAVDLLADRGPGASAVKSAVDRVLEGGGRVWLVAGCLPILLERLEEAFEGEPQRGGAAGGRENAASRARKSLREFIAKAGVLTSHGFHAEEALQSEGPMAAFTLRAADALGEDVRILSRNPAWIASDPRVVTPEAFAPRKETREEGRAGKMPFVDLARQQHRILPELEKRIFTVLRHGQYILGPEIEELERKLAAYAGAKHAISCASGTDALLLALMAYGVGPGHGVFTSPFTFISTAEVISLLGATPVFVDIDPRTFNMDPGCLETAIRACKENNPGRYPLPAASMNSSTPLEPKGIIPVDLFGLPADYDRINAIAAAHGLFVIEDAAQSFGAEYQGRRAGSLGDIGCTSFFPAKPLGCYGDGGAVFTENADLAERMVSMRVHGKGKDKYDNERIGLNGRMDTLQAALLLPKLAIFPGELAARNRVADRYTALLSKNESLETPWIPKGLKSAWAQYSILTDRREVIQTALGAKGIPTAVYYPKPLHLQTAYASLGYRQGAFPICESAARRILSLPMHPYLRDDQVTRIAREIEAVLTTEQIQGPAPLSKDPSLP